MSSAKITLYSFAKWMNLRGSDLFSNLATPAGIERDILIDNILLRGGEFEVVYSDPTFMQYAIGTWSRKWYRTMRKWIEALSIDYNPLENYDRYEDYRDIGEKTNKLGRTLNHADETLYNSQDKRTIDTDSLNTRNLRDEEERNLEDKETRDLDDTTTYDHQTSTEQLVSAYDSSTYQPSSMTINTNGVESGGQTSHNTDKLEQGGTDTFEHTGTDVFSHTGYDDTKNTGTDTMDKSGSDRINHTGTITDDGNENSFNSHAGHLHGNIGVTTSQQMLEAELSIDEWNIYEHITDLFLSEFVIPIYT